MFEEDFTDGTHTWSIIAEIKFVEQLVACGTAHCYAIGYMKHKPTAQILLNHLLVMQVF